MRRTSDVPCHAAVWAGRWRVGCCQSDPERNRARSGQVAESTTVFARLSFFAAGPSTAHSGGGRNSAMAVESALYHRDEIQSAVRAPTDQMGWAWLAGL